jgi:DNA modification methylase
MNKIEFGDCREIMKRWIDEGVKIQTCITSPPYYGLRDYGTATWEGGDVNCNHQNAEINPLKVGGFTGDRLRKENGSENKKYLKLKEQCPDCGAIKKDNQIGLEQTPKEYIENMVDVFNHVKELLADDGTLWVNIGDSYARTGGDSSQKGRHWDGRKNNPNTGHNRYASDMGLKAKDLIGIPWMLAFALREAGWYLRQDIIWHKPNPMPESVTDRCTKSHEYIFLLSKSPQYYFDHVAIKEPSVNPESYKGRKKRSSMTEQSEIIMDKFGATRSGFKNIEEGKTYPTRNKRDVWKVNVRPYKGAHFATYPTALIEPCVLAGSRKNDIVFDPFIGSGTTAQVALQHGRQYLGCELNKEYEKLQQERIGNG